MSCGWHQNAQSAVQLSEHQLTAEEKEVDQRRLCDQHLEKIYRQEESAGARKRQWQPTVCAGKTCCPLFHKGPEYLSKCSLVTLFLCSLALTEQIRCCNSTSVTIMHLPVRYFGYMTCL